MQVNLVYFRPDGDRKDIPLHGSEVLIGRGEDCNLRIPLAAVSRQHCRIMVGEDEVVIEDLGSSNGSLVNGKRVGRVSLKAGDRIQVGSATFVVQVDGKPKKVLFKTEAGPGAGAVVEEPEMLAGSSAGGRVPGSAGIGPVLDDSGAGAVEVEAAEENAVEVEEVGGAAAESLEEVVEIAQAEEGAEVESGGVVAEAGDGEVVLEEEAPASGAEEPEVAIDLESVDVGNDGAGSSSVEDILLELEAAEEEEAKKKR